MSDQWFGQREDVLVVGSATGSRSSLCPPPPEVTPIGPADPERARRLPEDLLVMEGRWPDRLAGLVELFWGGFRVRERRRLERRLQRTLNSVRSQGDITDRVRDRCVAVVTQWLQRQDEQ